MEPACSVRLCANAPRRASPAGSERAGAKDGKAQGSETRVGTQRRREGLAPFGDGEHTHSRRHQTVRCRTAAQDGGRAQTNIGRRGILRGRGDGCRIMEAGASCRYHPFSRRFPDGHRLSRDDGLAGPARNRQRHHEGGERRVRAPADLEGARRAAKSGTSPEELIAAAHAEPLRDGARFGLGNAGHPPERLTTSATVTFQPGTGITKIQLTVAAGSRARPGGVQGSAAEAKAGARSAGAEGRPRESRSRRRSRADLRRHHRRRWRHRAPTPSAERGQCRCFEGVAGGIRAERRGAAVPDSASSKPYGSAPSGLVSAHSALSGRR